MSTNAIIARETAPGKFIGRYHHSDGYPTHLGRTLYQLFNGFFAGDLARMKTFLIDEHPAGWSFISADQDFSLPAGYVDGADLYEKKANGSADWDKPIPHGPRCYCHGKRHDEALTVTEEELQHYEWTYVLSGINRMTVYMRTSKVAEINLDGPEPKWDRVECGENLDRCGHYAWVHFPELQGTIMDQLTTGEFMGWQALTVEDAYAYIIKGVECRRTGSGSQVSSIKDGSNLWAESLQAPEGTDPASTFDGIYQFNFKWAGDKKIYGDRRFWHPIMRYNAKGERVLIRGVKALYPPTLKDPIALFAELRKNLAPASADEDAPSAGISEDLLHLVSMTGRKFRED